MIWIVGIGCLLVGFIFGVLMTFGSSREKYTKWKPISITVESASTGVKYNANRYRFSEEDGLPYLRIYNHYTTSMEWLSIWHFKNPYIIMLFIDPEYAKEHMLELFHMKTGRDETWRT